MATFFYGHYKEHLICRIWKVLVTMYLATAPTSWWTHPPWRTRTSSATRTWRCPATWSGTSWAICSSGTRSHSGKLILMRKIKFIIMRFVNFSFFHFINILQLQYTYNFATKSELYLIVLVIIKSKISR